MSYETALDTAITALKAAKAEIQNELRAYPTPVSGCDAQYTHLIGVRASVSEALRALDAPAFVATPRMLSPHSRVESR